MVIVLRELKKKIEINDNEGGLITYIPSLQLKNVCSITEKGNVACEDKSFWFFLLFFIFFYFFPQQYLKIEGMSVFEFMLKHISPFSEGRELPLLFCMWIYDLWWPNFIFFFVNELI